MTKTKAAISRDCGGGGACDHGVDHGERDDDAARGGVRDDAPDGDGGDARDDVACRDDDHRP